MQMYYVDTNVHMDYLLERRYTWVFDVSLQCKFKIIISEIIIKELRYQNVEYEQLVAWLQSANKLLWHRVTDEDKIAAKRLLKYTHWNDALHATIAKKANATAIITRNIKDFKPIYITIHPDDI